MCSATCSARTNALLMNLLQFKSPRRAAHACGCLVKHGDFTHQGRDGNDNSESKMLNN